MSNYRLSIISFMLFTLCIASVSGCMLGKKFSASVIGKSLVEGTTKQLDIEFQVQLTNESEEWLKIRQFDLTVMSKGKLVYTSTEKVWIIVPVKGKVTHALLVKVPVSALNAESIKSLQEGEFPFKFKVDVTVVTPEEDVIVSTGKSSKVEIPEADQFLGIQAVVEIVEPPLVDEGEINEDILEPAAETSEDSKDDNEE